MGMSINDSPQQTRTDTAAAKGWELMTFRFVPVHAKTYLSPAPAAFY